MTPLLRVTDAGAAAATLASPLGPFIRIVRWRLADGYGYDPSPGDTELNGNVVYTDIPRSYQNVGDNTLDIVCQLPPASGPFSYGEIGLYIEDGLGGEVLFAKGVWEYPQTKESSLGTNINSQITFHCLLKLQQSIAILKVDTKFAVSVWEVDLWSDVIVPSVSAHSEVPLVLVRELDSNDDSTLLHTNLSDSDTWTIGTTYDFLTNTTVSNASSTSLTIPLASVPVSIRDSYVNRRLVIELGGYGDPYRSVSAITPSGADLILTLNQAPLSSLPSLGAPVTLYEQRIHKKVPIATRTVAGIVKPGDGLSLDSAGQIATKGLLHGVPGAGRALTSADNLDLLNWNSGEYWIATSLDVPAGLPVNTGGRVRISNPDGQTILQQFFPYATTNYNSDHGRAWWRFYVNGQWYSWRSTATAGSGINIDAAGTMSTMGLLHGVPGSGRNLTGSDNLNIVSWNSGEYWAQSTPPIGSPPGVSVGGRIRISNPGSAGILQQYFPFPTNSSYISAHAKEWWRMYLSTGWTPWRSTPNPGSGLNSTVDGIFSTQGLLHGVPGSGQSLNAVHNINAVSWGSGEYGVPSSINRPIGLPGAAWNGGRLRISNFDGHVLQEFFPMWTTTDPNDPNSQSWWRIWNVSKGWGMWQKAGYSPPTPVRYLQYYGSLGGNTSVSGTFSRDGEVIYGYSSGGDPAMSGTIAGVTVTYADSNGGGEGITLIGYTGASWSIWARRSGAVYRLSFM